MLNIKTKKQSEKGNVLFLILIAVALFAALSYVVTQSTRSGGGSTEREKNILSSAQMTQYPTALRTSLIRLVLGGVGIEKVLFDVPGSTDFATSTNLQVFHPNGGGAGYQEAPSDLSASGTTNLIWRYNAEIEVPGVGLDGAAGNDVIAFLPGISDGVCKQVNEELGLNVSDASPACTGGHAGPDVDGVEASVDANMITGYTFPATAADTLEAEGCTNIFARQASGCFYDMEGGRNVFYSVLLER